MTVSSSFVPTSITEIPLYRFVKVTQYPKESFILLKILIFSIGLEGFMKGLIKILIKYSKMRGDNRCIVPPPWF